MLNHKTCLRSRGNTQAQAGTGEKPPRELKGCWVSREQITQATCPAATQNPRSRPHADRKFLSPWCCVLVRQHATCILGERSLGRRVAKRVLPLLGRIVGHDPDANVRRLAILSLRWWQKDSRQCADLIRKALNDPATDVRAAAADWLREQDASQVS